MLTKMRSLCLFDLSLPQEEIKFFRETQLSSCVKPVIQIGLQKLFCVPLVVISVLIDNLYHILRHESANFLLCSAPFFTNTRYQFDSYKAEFITEEVTTYLVVKCLSAHHVVNFEVVFLKRGLIVS